MKKIWIASILSASLLAPLPTMASTPVAPSPLSPAEVSVSVSVDNLVNRTGTLQLGFTASYIANYLFNPAPGDTMGGAGTFSQNYDDTANEGITRLFFGFTQSMAAQVVAGNRWANVSSSARAYNFFGGAGVGSQYSFDFGSLTQQPGDGRFAIVCMKIRYNHAANTSTGYVVCSETFQLFNSDRPALPTLTSTPTLSISDAVVTFGGGTWSSGSIQTLIYACRNNVTGPESGVGDPTASGWPAGPLNSADCYDLSGTSTRGSVVTSLTSAYIWRSGTPAPYLTWRGTFNKLVAVDRVNTDEVWARSTVQTYAFSNVIATPQSPNVNLVNAESEEEVPPPVYYGGPKVSSFVTKGVSSAPSNQMQFVGKRMNKITSASIGGLNATMIATRNTLEIRVPEGLAAGTYDLVLQTTSGRLTIIRFVTVR